VVASVNKHKEDAREAPGRLPKLVHGRALRATFAAFGASVFLLGGTASAHLTRHKKARTVGGSFIPEGCVVRTLPGSFMDQGGRYASSSVADVVEVSCEPVYDRGYVKVSATQLYDRCQKRLAWYLPYPYPNPEAGSGPSYRVRLDDDGNATVVVIAGPSCAAGESLISAHLEEAPYTTATTAFAVLPPRDGELGLRATPAAKVEGEIYGDVATVVQVEFPAVFGYEPVAINASQLYSRCRRTPRLVWLTVSEESVGEGIPAGVVAHTEAEEGSVVLDGDGNAFVVLLGGASCAVGPSTIEASLEHAPYTTYTTTFTVEAPVPGFGR
jgi:hypothetical protein